MQPALLRLGRLLRQGLRDFVTGHAIASNPSGGGRGVVGGGLPLDFVSLGRLPEPTTPIGERHHPTESYTLTGNLMSPSRTTWVPET